MTSAIARNPLAIGRQVPFFVDRGASSLRPRGWISAVDPILGDEFASRASHSQHSLVIFDVLPSVEYPAGRLGTPGLVPQAYDPIGQAPPSVVETPADTPVSFLPLWTPFSLEIRCPPNRVNSRRGVASDIDAPQDQTALNIREWAGGRKQRFSRNVLA